MKKAVAAVMLAVVMLLTAAGGAYANTQTPAVTINGIQVDQSLTRMQNGTVYVDIEQMNKLPGVFALDNYGLPQTTTGTEQAAPEQRTSVASLTAQEKDHGISIVVNKTDGAAYLATYQQGSGSYEVPLATVPVRVIIGNQGIVFVPLRQVATALGVKVDWDQAANTVTVTE